MALLWIAKIELQRHWLTASELDRSLCLPVATEAAAVILTGLKMMPVHVHIEYIIYVCVCMYMELCVCIYVYLYVYIYIHIYSKHGVVLSMYLYWISERALR